MSAQGELVPQGNQQQNTQPSTALELSGKGIYRDLPSLIEGFNQLRERFNVCFPVMKPDIIPVMYAVALRPVAIDVRIDSQTGKPLSADVYQDERDKTKFGLSRIALDKMAAAANLSWHPAYTGRVDDESELFFRRYRACGVVRGLDGTPRIITKHKSIDLRVSEWREETKTNRRDNSTYKVRVVVEGGKDALGMTEKALAQARQFIDEQCETKAMNRVIRAFAFIKGLYTKEELQRPFVIAALVFTGETDDPELRREVAKAMVQQATNATTALFGPVPSVSPQVIDDPGRRTAPPQIGGATAHDDDDDTDDAGEGSDDTRSAAPDPF